MMRKENMKVMKYHTELDNRLHNVLVAEECYNCELHQMPKDIVSFMNDTFKLNRMAEEYAYMIAYNVNMKPLGIFEISHGTVTSSIVSPRDVMIKALLCGATSFVLIHNHPSGDVNPSKDDLLTTKRMKEVGELMLITLADHIIIGADNYYSFRENNTL